MEEKGQKTAPSSLGEEELKKLLIEKKVTDEKTLQKVSDFALKSEITLSEALVQKNILSDEKLGKLKAEYLKIPFISLSNISLSEEVYRIVPERVARQQKIVAFAADDSEVKVAMIDPANRELIDLLAKKTGKKIIPHMSTRKNIINTFHIYKKDLQKAFDNLLHTYTLKKMPVPLTEEAPTSKVVDMIIDFAYQNKASDIHAEPQEKYSLFRFRIDGILHDVLQMPKYLHDRVISRIKVLSRLRTDEHLSAQDGKMRMILEDEDLDVRVSIIPIADGEKAVLRLLSSRARQYSLSDLGMSETDLEKVTAAFNKAYGMILSTGPTGSGKTTTIYAILKILNTREKNITTIEDPVEYRIKGVNQIQVNPKTNLTFAKGLRSILRQDPNIIFVGEIRDIETAGIAVNAALTGHLVLSTLHTNDAATALPRLIDMKVEPYLVASTVNIIVAQRLVRKICDACKTSQSVVKKDLVKNIPAEVLKKHFGTSENITSFEGKGCKICHLTGYSGRVGVFEVLKVSKEIRRLIAEKADSDVIAQAAIKEGMTTMLDDGLDKVKAGTTTIEEVLRVTKVESI